MLEVAGSRLKLEGCRLEVPAWRLQVAGCRLEVAGGRLKVRRLEVAGWNFFGTPACVKKLFGWPVG